MCLSSAAVEKIAYLGRFVLFRTRKIGAGRDHSRLSFDFPLHGMVLVMVDGDGYRL